MFSGCTSLTNAPDLPATTLGSMCYYSMFSRCSSLCSVKISYEGKHIDNYFLDWVNGVASNGTFYYNGNDEPTDFGFPSAWHKEKFN